MKPDLVFADFEALAASRGMVFATNQIIELLTDELSAFGRIAFLEKIGPPTHFHWEENYRAAIETIREKGVAQAIENETLTFAVLNRLVSRPDTLRAVITAYMEDEFDVVRDVVFLPSVAGPQCQIFSYSFVPAIAFSTSVSSNDDRQDLLRLSRDGRFLFVRCPAKDFQFPFNLAVLEIRKGNSLVRHLIPMCINLSTHAYQCDFELENAFELRNAAANFDGRPVTGIDSVDGIDDALEQLDEILARDDLKPDERTLIEVFRCQVLKDA